MYKTGNQSSVHDFLCFIFFLPKSKCKNLVNTSLMGLNNGSVTRSTCLCEGLLDSKSRITDTNYSTDAVTTATMHLTYIMQSPHNIRDLVSCLISQYVSQFLSASISFANLILTAHWTKIEKLSSSTSVRKNCNTSPAVDMKHSLMQQGFGSEHVDY